MICFRRSHVSVGRILFLIVYRLCCSTCLLVLFGFAGCQPPEQPSGQLSKRSWTASEKAQSLKIRVDRTGVYRIPITELQSFGWTSARLSGCSFTSRGDTVPFWVDRTGEGLAFCFFGQAIESRYTPYGAYILKPGGEQRPITPGTVPPKAGRSRPVDFRSTTRFEKNCLYEPLAEVSCPWFWVRTAAPEEKSLEIELHGLTSDTGTLRIRLWAKTQAPCQPDHHLRLSVNGTRVLDQLWDGSGTREFVTRVTGVLKEGTNRIEFESPGDTAAPADMVFIDWLDISYPRKFVAESDNWLRLNQVSGDVKLQDFWGPVTVVRIENEHKISLAASTDSTFRAEAGCSYFVVGPKGFLKPTRIELLRTDPDLRRANLEADYIAVGSAELLDEFGPLLNALKGRGLRTAAIPSDAICDQFHEGIVEPEAIRTFLRFAAERWRRPPRYLLLVGDASYDTLGFLTAPNPSFLPGFFVRTAFGGETVTDLEFARLNGSHPLLAVGRIPANTGEQVRGYVEKAVRFQKRETAKVRQTILALADSSEPSFIERARSFLGRFPDTYKKRVLPLDRQGAGGSSTPDRLLLPDPLFLFYFGHGSVRGLGRDQASEGTGRTQIWKDTQAPFVFHVSCLSGFYAHPGIKCVAEELLLSADSQVVALLAPSSLTLPQNQRFMTEGLAAGLVEKRSIGDAVLQALTNLDPKIPGQREVMETFLLFGCPALEIPGNKSELNHRLSRAK